VIRVLKLVGVELIVFLCACAVGAFIWILIASGYEGATDAYMAANGGYSPPPGMFRAPHEWRFVILFAPYTVAMALRVWFGQILARLLSRPINA
jgi:hypothetical protein